MKIGETIERKYCGDKFYLVFDVTDPYHEIEVGSCYSLDAAKDICRQHTKSFPGAKLQVFEMVREDY